MGSCQQESCGVNALRFWCPSLQEKVGVDKINIKHAVITSVDRDDLKMESSIIWLGCNLQNESKYNSRDINS
jgi:lipoate synthase